MDLNQDQAVNSSRELFGNQTEIAGTSKPATNGFEALAQYDEARLGGNGDRVIDKNDIVWKQVRIWIDRNHNAEVDAGEVSTLDSLGIISISLGHIDTPDDGDGHANGHYFKGTFERRVGSSIQRGLVEDVYFYVPFPQ